jgi:hypothetical protein
MTSESPDSIYARLRQEAGLPEEISPATVARIVAMLRPATGINYCHDALRVDGEEILLFERGRR